MNNNLLKSLGISDSDMLHRVIGTTFIVEYGIIKKIQLLELLLLKWQ